MMWLIIILLALLPLLLFVYYDDLMVLLWRRYSTNIPLETLNDIVQFLPCADLTKLKFTSRHLGRLIFQRQQTIGDSFQRHLPICVPATVRKIEEGGTKFSISCDDERIFKWKMNIFYSNPVNRKEVQINDIKIGDIYVCRHYGNNFERCRLSKMSSEIYAVYLLESAKYEAIKPDELFYIAACFNKLDYSFVLNCYTPTIHYLKFLKLPTLNEFRVEEKVEVVLCSLVEPCLAVVGSINRFLRIHFDGNIDLSNKEIQSWKKLFSNSKPSLKSVIYGQYPPFHPVRFSLATVAAYVSLDKVYVRDILSSIRLSYLQKMINEFYGKAKNRDKMQFSDRAKPVLNLPCVVFDDISKQYLRAKILRLNEDCTFVDVVAVDYPCIIIEGNLLSSLYLLSDMFIFQPQYFQVSLVDDINTNDCLQYSVMAKHYLPIGFFVSIARHSNDSLVTLKCADDEDVLQKIGYSSKWCAFLISLPIHLRSLMRWKAL